MQFEKIETFCNRLEIEPEKIVTVLNVFDLNDLNEKTALFLSMYVLLARMGINHLSIISILSKTKKDILESNSQSKFMICENQFCAMDNWKQAFDYKNQEWVPYENVKDSMVILLVQLESVTEKLVKPSLV